MKMKFMSEVTPLVQAFVILSSFTLCNAYIECFKCPVEPTEESKESLDCRAFDGSAAFKTRCFYSTFCEKKITHLTIANGTTITRVVRRDCAHQNDPKHYLIDRQWQLKDDIQKNIYQPGCFKDIDKNSPTGPATYCYCNTHYCNGVSSNIISKTFYIFVLLLITLHILG